MLLTVLGLNWEWSVWAVGQGSVSSWTGYEGVKSIVVLLILEETVTWGFTWNSNDKFGTSLGFTEASIMEKAKSALLEQGKKEKLMFKMIFLSNERWNFISCVWLSMHTLKYLCNQEISIEIFFQECPGKMIRKAPIQQGVELSLGAVSFTLASFLVLAVCASLFVGTCPKCKHIHIISPLSRHENNIYYCYSKQCAPDYLRWK